jgi:hypothetical protein
MVKMLLNVVVIRCGFLLINSFSLAVKSLYGDMVADPLIAASGLLVNPRGVRK